MGTDQRSPHNSGPLADAVEQVFGMSRKLAHPSVSRRRFWTEFIAVIDASQLRGARLSRCG